MKFYYFILWFLNLITKSAYFKICNNDNNLVTSSIILLLLLLSLNMFWVSYILFNIVLDKLCFIAIFVTIFFVVATQQSLSRSFSRKNFLKSLFKRFCVLSVMSLDNITWYARTDVFQLTRFKSAPGHGLKSTLNTSIFTMSMWVLLLTFCNLGLIIYDILSLLNCFSVLNPSWIISPKLITVFLLFTCVSYGGQPREGLIQLLIVCDGDTEVNLGHKIKS